MEKRLREMLNDNYIALKSGDKVLYYDVNAHRGVLEELSFYFEQCDIENYQHDIRVWSDGQHATASFCWIEKDGSLHLMTFNQYV